MLGKDVVTRKDGVKTVKLEVVIGMPTMRILLENNGRFRLAVCANDDVIAECWFDDVDVALDAYRLVKHVLCEQAKAVWAALEKVAARVSDGGER